MIGRTNSSSMSSTTTAALDFTVVDGLTEPVNPKEKMIWIATDEEITSWTFSATEPAAQQGLVWFQIGQSSQVAFSVTKDNPIMVYPIRAYQYINNSWAEKVTKIYLNDGWVTWFNTTYWFKQNEGPISSWSGNSQNGSDHFITVQKLQLLADGDSPNGVLISTNSKVDLTNFNTLYFDAEIDSDNSFPNGTFGVASSLTKTDQQLDANFIEGAKVKPDVKSRKIYQVDVSNLTGEYYIAMLKTSGANYGSIFVYNIYAS